MSSNQHVVCAALHANPSQLGRYLPENASRPSPKMLTPRAYAVNYLTRLRRSAQHTDRVSQRPRQVISDLIRASTSLFQALEGVDTHGTGPWDERSRKRVSFQIRH